MSKLRSDPFGNPLPPRMHYGRKRHYYHVKRERGRVTWTPLGPVYVVALSAWARLENAGAGARTVAQCVEAYLLDAGERLAPKTLRGYRNSQTRINDWAGAVFAAELTRPDVRAWLHTGKHRLTSANRDLALLRAALNHARECGVIGDNPAAGVRRLAGEKPRRREASRSELEAISAIAPPLWRALISLALLTGMREGEIRTLKRDQVTPDGLHVKHHKTGASTLINWSPALRGVVQSALDNHPRRVHSLYVFPSRNGGPYSEDGFKTVWGRLRDKAGAAGLQFRDLRRTAANYANDLQAAQALLGHTDARITGRVYRTRNTAEPNG